MEPAAGHLLDCGGIRSGDRRGELPISPSANEQQIGIAARSGQRRDGAFHFGPDAAFRRGWIGWFDEGVAVAGEQFVEDDDGVGPSSSLDQTPAAIELPLLTAIIREEHGRSGWVLLRRLAGVIGGLECIGDRFVSRERCLLPHEHEAEEDHEPQGISGGAGAGRPGVLRHGIRPFDRCFLVLEPAGPRAAVSLLATTGLAGRSILPMTCGFRRENKLFRVVRGLSRRSPVDAGGCWPSPFPRGGASGEKTGFSREGMLFPGCNFASRPSNHLRVRHDEAEFAG